MRLLVRIQDDDIRFGVQYNIEMNPAANAIRRYLAAGWDCQVTDSEIVLLQEHRQRHRFRAPAAVTRCVLEFDETGALEPFDFEWIADLEAHVAQAIQADLLPT